MKKYIAILIALSINFLSCETKEQNIVDSKFIPEQTSIVLFANVENTFAIKGLLEVLQNNTEFNNIKNNLIKNANINIEKDLKKIILSYNDKKDNTAIYANLNYNKKETLKTLKTNKQVKHKNIMNYDVITNYKIKTLNPKQKQNNKTAIALINNKNIILTEEKNINSHFDIINGKGNTINTQSNIYKQIKNVEHYNLLWGVIKLSDKIKNRIPNQQKTQNLIDRYIENIKLLSFGLETKDEKSHLFISSINEDIKTTNRLYNSIYSLINLAKSLLHPNSDETKILNSIKLTKRGNELIAEAFINEKQLVNLIAKSIKKPNQTQKPLK